MLVSYGHVTFGWSTCNYLHTFLTSSALFKGVSMPSPLVYALETMTLGWKLDR